VQWVVFPARGNSGRGRRSTYDRGGEARLSRSDEQQRKVAQARGHVREIWAETAPGGAELAALAGELRAINRDLWKAEERTSNNT
jgi:hypothetical protein